MFDHHRVTHMPTTTNSSRLAATLLSGTCARMDGVVFWGNDLIDGCAERRTPDQCCQACQAFRGCKAWTALLDTHPTCPGAPARAHSRPLTRPRWLLFQVSSASRRAPRPDDGLRNHPRGPPSPPPHRPAPHLRHARQLGPVWQRPQRRVRPRAAGGQHGCLLRTMHHNGWLPRVYLCQALLVLVSRWCPYFVWINSTHAGFHAYVPPYTSGGCYLKRQATESMLLPNPDVITGTVPGVPMPAEAPACSLNDGMDLFGNDMNNGCVANQRVASAAVCCARCQATVGCVGFSYAKPEDARCPGACYLKRQATASMLLPNRIAISGTVPGVAYPNNDTPPPPPPPPPPPCARRCMQS